MFKNKFSKFSLLFIFILLFFAIGLPLTIVEAQLQNPIGAGSFSEIAEAIIVWISNIGIAVAVIMIIYAGLLFMTSGGSEERISKAKTALIWSLVGLAVLIMGRGWITLIQNILGG